MPPKDDGPGRSLEGASRRELLGGGAGLALAALPGCKEALEDSGPPEPGQIDHVIVVMMENRSFDHYLGAFTLEEGREDIDGLTGDEVNLDASGYEVKPFPLPSPCQHDPPHGWNSSHSQFNEGKNDGFVKAHENGTGAQASWVMGYLRRNDLPVHYALADAYCLPDRFFCSVMGPTWPNRVYGHAGTSDGMKGNDFERTPFTMKTVYKALEEVGEDWRYYYTDVPFIGLFKDLWSDEKVTLIEDLFKDVERGDLPAFTWIDPGFTWNDDHPPHHPGLGQAFLGMVYEAIARSPIWDRVLLVITYDEHGGFFDHVPPPTSDDDHIEEGFDQLGFRVPAVIVGPWVKQGVDSTVYDNTSVLKYVCERFGITPWTARIAAANSLGMALDAERMESGIPLEPVVVPAVGLEPEDVGDECYYDFRSGVSSQPELEDWCRENLPEALRVDQMDAVHERLMARARKMGLVR